VEAVVAAPQWCHLAMKTDGKTPFLFPLLYFLAEKGSGSENTGLETESGHADARKRTNMDREPVN
jgi:hypothetical protein